MQSFNTIIVFKTNNGLVSSIFGDGSKVEGFNLNELIEGKKIAFSNKRQVIFTNDGSLPETWGAKKKVVADNNNVSWSKAGNNGSRTVWTNGNHTATKHRAKNGGYYYKVVS